MSVNSQKKKRHRKAESRSNKKFRQKTPVWPGLSEKEPMRTKEVMKKLWLGC